MDCPQCDHREAVLIQSTQNVKSNKLTLIFVCCNEHCGHKWCVRARGGFDGFGGWVVDLVVLTPYLYMRTPQNRTI